jgi:hypothetical protein
MNAKEELIEHIADRKVKYIYIAHGRTYNDNLVVIQGTLEEVLPRLNFKYDNGFGGQELEGTIWYEGGTWSERGEYDGSEWWEHRKCPECPV